MSTANSVSSTYCGLFSWSSSGPKSLLGLAFSTSLAWAVSSADDAAAAAAAVAADVAAATADWISSAWLEWLGWETGWTIGLPLRLLVRTERQESSTSALSFCLSCSLLKSV